MSKSHNSPISPAAENIYDWISNFLITDGAFQRPLYPTTTIQPIGHDGMMGLWSNHDESKNRFMNHTKSEEKDGIFHHKFLVPGFFKHEIEIAIHDKTSHKIVTITAKKKLPPETKTDKTITTENTVSYQFSIPLNSVLLNIHLDSGYLYITEQLQQKPETRTEIVTW